ncbi:transcriptional regulator TyrR [Morganella morganii]|uniref:transcriptional regulator TyrR n=1 Tax=Morganella morganii TaxID=582 RepID=UPI0034D5FEBE
MRLEVICQDRIGLTRELLDLLVLQNIDLKGIEIARNGRIYLNFMQIDFSVFQSLMAEIRRIQGVVDVRTVHFMPSEREQRAMWALLESLEDPILSLDLRGNIELANSAALSLFATTEERIRQRNITYYFSQFNFTRWIEDEEPAPYKETINLKGRSYTLSVTPINFDEKDDASATIGAVVLLGTVSESSNGQKRRMQVMHSGSFDDLVAKSAKMRHVVEQAQRMAKMDSPLLLVGETGTGKDVFAKACHLYSVRGNQPFLGLNCASMPDDVVETELFGYAAGAYANSTEPKKGFFEQANGGTVLLDEIAEMSPQMQIKLLRFLNDGTFRRVGEEHEVKVDVRVICATQKNLLELVKEGKFREDLYYRLNVLTLTIPPLREHQEDILPLTRDFVKRFSEEQGCEEPRLAPELGQFLCAYHWPGNVRQLRNVIYQALSSLEGSLLRPQDIVLPELEAEIGFSEDILSGSLDDITKRFECSVLTRLYRHYPSTRKLAKRLNVSHTAIANKLREYGLSQRRSAAKDDEGEEE